MLPAAVIGAAVNRTAAGRNQINYEGEEEIMIKVGIIGSTGYAGGELVRLLLQREDVEIKWYGSRSYIGQDYASVYANMFQLVDENCMDDNMKELAGLVDVVFTATPQGLCASLVDEEILSKVKVIDLSADFRIRDVGVYEQWYKLKHASPQFIGEAVYGLPEVNRELVKSARLIANPGCFPTCSFLTVYPLVKEGLIDPNTLIIDAKSVSYTHLDVYKRQVYHCVEHIRQHDLAQQMGQRPV